MIPDVFHAHEWSLVGNHVRDQVKGFHETELPAALLFSQARSGLLLQKQAGQSSGLSSKSCEDFRERPAVSRIDVKEGGESL
jgi:hypothetical protein